MKKIPIVAIVGRANVGKSSLLNAVIGQREAIVTREPGTTRDNVTAKASYKKHDFWLVDTAGLKTAEDDFEASIQDQILQASSSADVIWVVVEADKIINDEDRRVATLALKTKKPVILVINKIDKVRRLKLSEFQKLGIKTVVATSATLGRGLADLLNDLVKIIPRATLKTDPKRVRLAILGRPNVGKSSLFNALAAKQQAIVNAKAGTTRDINRLTIKYKGRELEIMDSAGIRRSGKIEPGVERFSVLRALSAIEQADVCLLVMDVQELNVALDQKIAGLVKEAGKGLVLVVSKWDLADEQLSVSRDQITTQVAHNFVFVPWAPLIFTSSLSGQNVTQIFELTLQINGRRQQKIKTSQLNSWLQKVVLKQPPAGVKNRLPKLKYIVQEQDNPVPSFKVFGSQTDYLHWSYKRFMERQLRETFDFSGTPIKFWFIDKDQNYNRN